MSRVVISDIDEMDDAIHIESLWDDRISLCGQWNCRNLTAFQGPIPNFADGCWTCLQAKTAINHYKNR